VERHLELRYEYMYNSPVLATGSSNMPRTFLKPYPFEWERAVHVLCSPTYLA
jgi:hypothetical protein